MYHACATLNCVSVQSLRDLHFKAFAHVEFAFRKRYLFHTPIDTSLIDLYTKASEWLNANQGVLSVVIVIATGLFGWLSGIFSGLRRKPKFKLSIVDGPSFSCTYSVGKNHQGYDAHRTGVALYLYIANVGSAPSSIHRISIGYHWNLHSFSMLWVKYVLGWFWLHNQTIALEDFQVRIGDNIKIYPFLIQRNNLSPIETDSFLEVGRSAIGVVYFEQAESWGGCFPFSKDGKVRVKVSVEDVFGNRHTNTFNVPAVTIEQARVYNPSFGKTHPELNGERLPHDVPLSAET